MVSYFFFSFLDLRPADLGLNGAYPDAWARSGLPISLLSGTVDLSSQGPCHFTHIPLAKASHMAKPDATGDGKADGNEWL